MNVSQYKQTSETFPKNIKSTQNVIKTTEFKFVYKIIYHFYLQNKKNFHKKNCRKNFHKNPNKKQCITKPTKFDDKPGKNLNVT